MSTDFGETRIGQMQISISSLYTELSGTEAGNRTRRRELTEQILREAAQLLELEDRITETMKAEQESADINARRQQQDRLRWWAGRTGAVAFGLGAVFFLTVEFVHWMSQWTLLLYLALAVAGGVLALKPVPRGADGMHLTRVALVCVAAGAVLAALIAIPDLPQSLYMSVCGAAGVGCVGGAAVRFFEPSEDGGTDAAAGEVAP